MEEEQPIVIPLGNNLVAWVESVDMEIANMGWSAKSAGRNRTPHYYAVHRFTIAGHTEEYYLHNLIWERMMDAKKPDGFLVDHINGDKLDNRRSNLRLATRTHNEANKRKRKGSSTSKYKGVTRINDGRKKCWRATISENHQQIALGTFYNEIDAAIAYNDAALTRWGDFALLNVLEDTDE